MRKVFFQPTISPAIPAATIREPAASEYIALAMLMRSIDACRSLTSAPVAMLSVALSPDVES